MTFPQISSINIGLFYSLIVLGFSLQGVRILSSIWQIFKPAKHQSELEDPQIIKDQYKYWRWRIFYSMYIGYAFYYFTRKSFTFAMPTMMSNLGFDESQLGFLGTVMSLTYGVSKFTSGVLADRSNPRLFMSIGLFITGLMNICFGLSSTLTLFALFWGLNGWFQGWGWPPCARLLTHWYSQKERGTWWGGWNTSHNVGGFIIAFLAAYCAQIWGWRAAMYAPGIICIIMSFFLYNRLRDTPQSLGLPQIEKFNNDWASGKPKKDRELTIRQILVEYVLKNKYIWILAVAYFFIYIIRQSVNDWTTLYLVKNKGYSIFGAAATVSWFEIGGALGAFIAGWSSDKIYRGRRGPINILFTMGALLFTMIFYMIPAGQGFLDSLLLFAIGFSIFGPQMLIGVTAAELSHKKAGASSTGFIGCFAYLGSAFAGYPMGLIIRDYGWNQYFIFLGLAAAIAAIILIPLWSIKSNPKLS